MVSKKWNMIELHDEKEFYEKEQPRNKDNDNEDDEWRRNEWFEGWEIDPTYLSEPTLRYVLHWYSYHKSSKSSLL